MNVILLSGGSGKRLWPLSNELRSKQILKLFGNESGNYESMVQRVYRQIREVDSNAFITIATAESQVSALKNQLGDKIDISVEPKRKDTFPAIALATLYLYDIKHVAEDEVVIVSPIDPYVDIKYFESFKELERITYSSDFNLSLIGIEPTYPSEKYGYIIPYSQGKISLVRRFKEKPTENKALEYINEGALWNGGVFAFKIKYLLKIVKKYFGISSYNELYKRYASLKKISFDYAVVEKEKSIQVLKFSGLWKDIGTWNTMVSSMTDTVIGNVIIDDTCKNLNVINELDVPILALGIENAVITASPDGILVSDRERSSYIKPYVEKMTEQVMYAEKSWGSYRVIDVEAESLTIKVTLKKGHGMNYHSHSRREEIWNIISGTGKVILEGKEKIVYAGDTIRIKANEKHTIFGLTELKIIEIQLGKEILVEDKKIFAFE